MAPKGGNAKKESGRAKKAENEEKKKQQAAAEKEQKEATKWDDGSKTKKSAQETKEEKRLADLARKAERERLLAEEEAAAASKPKPAPKAAAKKKPTASKPAGPGAIAAGGGIAGASNVASEEPAGGSDVKREREPSEEVEAFAATGIDGALELLEVVNAKKDKASVGQQAAGLEKHPERRFKAAFEAFQERELTRIRGEHPGLRKQQYNELLYKQFQKSPENPFNQTLVSYDATKEDRVAALERRNQEVEERLKERTKALNLGDD